MQKDIIIGCDHAGFDLKNKIIAHLASKGFDVTDAGTYKKESCDYPVIAKEVADKIVNEEYKRGILVCGTGIGMAIMANRVNGIRAAVLSDTCSAKMSRSHNDANILCIGERIVGEELAKDIVEIWLNTNFIGDRHTKRVEMFETL